MEVNEFALDSSFLADSAHMCAGLELPDKH